MKVSIFVSCCILTFYCVSVHGDLQIGLGKIKNLMTKAKEDLQTVLHNKSNKRNSNEGAIVFKDSEEEVSVATTSTAPEVTPDASVQISGDEVTSTPTVSTTTTGKIDATDKEGKENFAGGCSTGFLRTADGRCKPTFG